MFKIMNFPLPTFLVLIALFAGAPVYAAADGRQLDKVAKPQTFVFHCEGDYTFVARVEDNIAWLFLPAKTLDLSQVSPDVFQRGDLRFQINGQTGQIEDNGNVIHRCQNNRREAIWEHAKLNGADFRAVGNEPGWHLEIYGGSKAVLVTGYGATRHEFDLLPPQVEGKTETTVLTSRSDKPRIVLKITGKDCSDTMSGEQFESRVDVDLDGKVLHGCGRALH